MIVSVITVCKNSQATIEKNIKSVVEQNYKNIEYIIIDGDSQDETKKIIAKYSQFINKFISEPDSGLYEAMNKGVRLATGDFIYFLNSDDYLLDREVIQDVVTFIAEHPASDFFYGDVEHRSIYGEVFLYKSPLPENLQEEMIYGCAIPQPASFFKADLFSKLGFFNESYKIASDYEWFTRLIQAENTEISYYSRTISSYYCGGLSGKNLKLAYREMFTVQSKIPTFNSELWLEKRLIKLQDAWTEQNDLIQKLQNLAEARHKHAEDCQKLAEARAALINAQEKKIAAIEEKIAIMEKSKFWRLRTVWFKLKSAVVIK